MSKTPKTYPQYRHSDAHTHTFVRIRFDMATNAAEFEDMTHKAVGAITAPGDVADSFIITPTYAIPVVKELTIEKDDTAPTSLMLANDIASKVISSYPRAHGLCGVPYFKDYAAQIATHCVQLPGMIGMKVRGMNLRVDRDDDYRFKYGPKNREAFEKLMELAHDSRKVLLAHFEDADNSTWQKSTFGNSVETTKYLIEVAQKYPHAQLIIAHSGTQSFIGLDGLKYIGNWYKEHPEVPRNIWMETSFGIFMGTRVAPVKLDNKEEAQALFVKAWREFGIDYTLYGSDWSAIEDDHKGFFEVRHDPYDSPRNSLDLLAPDERKKVAYANMKRLLKLVK